MPIELLVNGEPVSKYIIKLNDVGAMFEELASLELKKGDKVEFFITSGGKKMYCVVDCFQLLPEGVEPYAK